MYQRSRCGSLEQICAYLRAIYTEFLFDEDCGITVNFPMTVLETAPRRAGDADLFPDLIGGEFASLAIFPKGYLGRNFLSHDT
jgi:hypothetical protein